MVWTDPVSQDLELCASCRTTTASRSWPSTRPACSSPSGSGAPTRGPSWCAASTSPRSWVPRRWSCTRRFAGSATTPASSSPGWSGWPGKPTCGSPWRTCSRCAFREQRVGVYIPDWSPVDQDYRHVTLDLSHTSVSQSDALAMARALGDRLTHVHLADGLGSPRDEHLVPGRGNQPCAELLERLAERAYNGPHRDRGEHPPGRSRGPNARPTWRRRSRSPGSISPHPPAPARRARCAPPPPRQNDDHRSPHPMLRTVILAASRSPCAVRNPAGANSGGWRSSATACGSTSRTVTSATST